MSGEGGGVGDGLELLHAEALGLGEVVDRRHGLEVLPHAAGGMWDAMEGCEGGGGEGGGWFNPRLPTGQMGGGGADPDAHTGRK